MSLTKLTSAVSAALLALGAAAAPSSEVADLAARVAFGYYDRDAHVIEAAHDELVRLGDDPDARYQRALAALRLTQLRAQQGAPLGEWPAECAEAAPPGDAGGPAAAERWLLVAACSQVADRGEPGEAPGRDRRREQALMRARELDPANPRLALLEALEISDRPALAEPAARAAASGRLRAALESFAARQAPPGGPDWGEPEALALLAETVLAAGEVRAARDLVERALLIAPDYRFALDVQKKLQAAAKQ
jgi:hypothetical protein